MGKDLKQQDFKLKTDILSAGGGSNNVDDEFIKKEVLEFLQEWEPRHESVFLCAFFVWFMLGKLWIYRL